MLAPLVVWVLVVLLAGPFYAVAALIFGLWRLFVNFIVAKFKPDFEAHFTTRDLAFTSDDFEGKVRKSLINVSVMKGQLDLTQLRQGVQARIVDNPYCFKFHCRPVLYLGYWFWQRTEIDLDSHITEHSDMETDDSLKPFLAAWGAVGYGPGRPLWAVMLVHMDNGRTAIITKYHHMMGDGVSVMRLLEDFCDGGWVHLQTPPVKSMTFPHWVYAWFTFWWNVVKSYRLARIRKGFRPTRFCGDGFTCWTEVSLEKIRVIRRSCKCLFQSVMAGVMSTAFQRLLEHTGKDVPEYMRMVVPIPYPYRTDKTMTNHCGWLHTEMPVGGGVKALKAFEASVKSTYRLGMHGVMWEFFKSMYLMPEPFLKHYTTWGEVNIPPVLFSSVPGTLGQVNILGLEVLQSFGVLGLGCSMGVNATVTTYKDTATFSIRVNKEFVSSQALLNLMVEKYVHEELDLLYHQALTNQLMEGSESDSNCNNHPQIKVHSAQS